LLGVGKRFRLRGDGLEWRTVEGEIVALDLPADTYLGLNRSGAVLWQALAHGASADELVEKLTAEYQIDTTQAARDVGQFIAALRAQGVIEPIEE
jgi:hypothetical protein